MVGRLTALFSIILVTSTNIEVDSCNSVMFTLIRGVYVAGNKQFICQIKCVCLDVDRNGETLTERMRPFGQKNVKDAAHWEDVAGGRGARSAIFVIVEIQNFRRHEVDWAFHSAHGERATGRDRFAQSEIGNFQTKLRIGRNENVVRFDVAMH